MSDSKFSLATNDDRAKRAQSTDRTHYQWYQHYLYPIPTLFNATLGDTPGGTRSLPGAPPPIPPTAQDKSLPPPSLLEMMLTPEQMDALADVEEKHGERGLAHAQVYLQMDPAFAAPGEHSASERGLFSSGYDSKTGVPDADVPPLFSYQLPRGLFAGSSSGVRDKLIKEGTPLETPADYKTLYAAFLKDAQGSASGGDKVLGYDQLSDVWNSDVILGWQRLAGTNPRVLKALTSDRAAELFKKMPLTDAHVAAVAGPGATILSEIQGKRLYFCDYWLLDGLPLQEGRYMPAAIGVFWSDTISSQLLPVAIQLGQTPGRIRTPGEQDWPIARLQFEVADFNYHEMGTHLSEAHFAQEAFIVATRRNLPDEHPIGGLLVQIYFALLYNNALGRLQLVNPGGYTDRMMAGDLNDGSLAIVRNYYTKVWTWDDWNLDNYLNRQGTTDTTALPVYPYRDDGLPLWGAIKAFAASYVDAYYPHASDVAGDTELAAWVAELVDPAKGNLDSRGFPRTVTSKADLAEVVARLVWQASPGHGGINYSQWQHFAVIPNAPGAAYATEGPLMGALPQLVTAAYQSDIINVLTQKVFGRLGQYDSDFTRRLNLSAKNAIKLFQDALATCAASVDARNASYPRAFLEYPFLHPGNLPNSTNI